MTNAGDHFVNKSKDASSLLEMAAGTLNLGEYKNNNNNNNNTQPSPIHKLTPSLFLFPTITHHQHILDLTTCP